MMQITYYGQSSFLLEVNHKKILFDPFISANPLAKEIEIDNIETDYVLLSHGHQDHVLDAESILRRTGATLITSYEIASWYAEKGIENGIGMNIGGKLQLDHIGSLRCVNAVHSSTMPDGTYGANPMGFVLDTPHGTLYFAGDTALTYDMKLLPELYNKIDASILPIGGHYTMDVEDAVRAAKFVHCKKVIGCHYDTFDLIKIDHSAAKKLFSESELELILPTIGQPFEL